MPSSFRRAVLLQLIEGYLLTTLLLLLLVQPRHLVLATELHLLGYVITGRGCVAELQALDFARQSLVQRCSVKQKLWSEIRTTKKKRLRFLINKSHMFDVS